MSTKIGKLCFQHFPDRMRTRSIWNEWFRRNSGNNYMNLGHTLAVPIASTEHENTERENTERAGPAYRAMAAPVLRGRGVGRGVGRRGGQSGALFLQPGERLLRLGGGREDPPSLARLGLGARRRGRLRPGPTAGSHLSSFTARDEMIFRDWVPRVWRFFDTVRYNSKGRRFGDSVWNMQVLALLEECIVNALISPGPSTFLQF